MNEIEKTPNLELTGIISRRADKLDEEINHRVVSSITELDADAGILTTESEILLESTPRVLKHCDTIDSFDIHSKMQDYFKSINNAAKKNNRIALYAYGWDPGLFSQMRLLFETFIPDGETLHEYGVKLPSGGVSRGHSAELNREYSDRIELAVSRTFPKNDDGQNVREVTLKTYDGVNNDKLIEDIMDHPYFKGDDVTFKFASLGEVKEQFTEEHSGRVIRKSKNNDEIQDSVKLELILNSNPKFTACVLVTGLRALLSMREVFGPGAYNMTQVPINYYSPRNDAEIRSALI